MESETKGKIVSTFVPGFVLLGTRLGDWYDRNPYHRFEKGDILILRDRRIFGYGVRPVAVVNGFEIKDFGFGIEGKYNITMYRDAKEDFFQWATRNEILHGVERIVNEHEIHFKWNIENQFKKVNVNSVDEALALYASEEAEPREKAA